MAKNKKQKQNEAEQDDFLARIAENMSDSTRPNDDEAFARYIGEDYKQDKEAANSNKSTFKATDVWDVVEAVYAQGAAVILSDNKLIQFQAIKAGDEDKAKQETDIIHHLMRGKSGSFEPLMMTWKGGLIYNNAYMWSGWRDKKITKIQHYENIDFDSFNKSRDELLEKAEAENWEHDCVKSEGILWKKDGDKYTPEQKMDEDGKPMPIVVIYRLSKIKPTYCMESVHPSEMFISPQWDKVSLQECPTVSRRQSMTRAELEDMGFDVDDIMELSENKLGADTNSDNRHETQQSDDTSNSSHVEDLTDITESYVRVNGAEKGGVAIYKIWTDAEGGKILKWADGTKAIDEVDRIPFISWTSHPVPNRHVGVSLASKAVQSQLLSTTLMRRALDHVDSAVYARPVIDSSQGGNIEDIKDDLMAVDDMSPIVVNGQNVITYPTPQSILGDLLPLKQLGAQMLEKTTGAQEHGQGLGFEALDKSNIGSIGATQIMAASKLRMEGLLRAFVELVIRPLALQMHADMMQRGDPDEKSLMIRGEWIEYDPSKWMERTELAVRVGSGRSDALERVQALGDVIGLMEKTMGAGLPIVSMTEIRNAFMDYGEAKGLPNMERYIKNPEDLTDEEKAPKPPTETEKAQTMIAQASIQESTAKVEEAKTKRLVAEFEKDIKIAEFKSNEKKAAIELQIQNVKLKQKDRELSIKQAEARARIENLDASTDQIDKNIIDGDGKKDKEKPKKATKSAKKSEKTTKK